jgi:hypothetical protein
MRPVVNVMYEREAYLATASSPENDARITLDKNLRSVAWPAVGDLFDETRAKPVFNGHFILEIKFNHYCPTWLRDIIESFKISREAASKYTACVENEPEIHVERPFQTFYKSAGL